MFSANKSLKSYSYQNSLSYATLQSPMLQKWPPLNCAVEKLCISQRWNSKPDGPFSCFSTGRQAWMLTQLAQENNNIE